MNGRRGDDLRHGRSKLSAAAGRRHRSGQGRQHQFSKRSSDSLLLRGRLAPVRDIRVQQARGQRTETPDRGLGTPAARRTERAAGGVLDPHSVASSYVPSDRALKRAQHSVLLTVLANYPTDQRKLIGRLSGLALAGEQRGQAREATGAGFPMVDNAYCLKNGHLILTDFGLRISEAIRSFA